MDLFKPRLDDRSPDEWLAEAEKYQKMARRFRHKSELSKTFNALAEDAYRRAATAEHSTKQRKPLTRPGRKAWAGTSKSLFYERAQLLSL